MDRAGPVSEDLVCLGGGCNPLHCHFASPRQRPRSPKTRSLADEYLCLDTTPTLDARGRRTSVLPAGCHCNFLHSIEGALSDAIAQNDTTTRCTAGTEEPDPRSLSAPIRPATPSDAICSGQPMGAMRGDIVGAEIPGLDGSDPIPCLQKGLQNGVQKAKPRGYLGGAAVCHLHEDHEPRCVSVPPERSDSSDIHVGESQPRVEGIHKDHDRSWTQQLDGEIVALETCLGFW